MLPISITTYLVTLLHMRAHLICFHHGLNMNSKYPCVHFYYYYHYYFQSWAEYLLTVLVFVPPPPPKCHQVLLVYHLSIWKGQTLQKWWWSCQILIHFTNLPTIFATILYYEWPCLNVKTHVSTVCRLNYLWTFREWGLPEQSQDPSESKVKTFIAFSSISCSTVL